MLYLFSAVSAAEIVAMKKFKIKVGENIGTVRTDETNINLIFSLYFLFEFNIHLFNCTILFQLVEMGGVVPYTCDKQWNTEVLVSFPRFGLSYRRKEAS